MSDPANIPRVGMIATVRNRRGLVVSVDPFDAKPEGRLHLVRVEYTDGDGAQEDTILWERERHRSLLEPTAMPRVDGEPPMPAADFDALVRATRWSALTPFVRPDVSGPPERRGAADTPAELPIASPFFGAVQVEDFQLVPLLKALQMPRVSLLLADDVGLGKTIEAGLILTELLLRRRIRRVLVLTPASLRKQWQQEMRDKFSLSFDVVDRDETHALQARLGLDANPWRTFPRIIASYYYLRQPDVLEQFLAVCRTQAAGAYQLPWDLLVVDEAHNLMPSSFGDDSDLAKMLRAITPYFEHKLFLTATPHNGHTRSFTGLLEQLDPVRFTQKSELTDAERTRVEDVLVRRLKSEINALDDKLKRPRRFADRFAEGIPLYFPRGGREHAVVDAFAALRAALKRETAIRKDADRTAGSFAIEVLGKRLLSCPSTFADSWYRFKLGLAEAEAASASEVFAARRASEEEIDDDREREGRAQHAARTAGAWLQPFAGALATQIAGVDAALVRLGIEVQGDALTEPKDDARFEQLSRLVEKHLRNGKKWVDDERLILFTEYKTTLDYVERRLRRAFGGEDAGAIRILYGGMNVAEREAIKRAFNDPEDPVRILVATDAAAEGLNLQETARRLLHYEVPWNPSRLEQRNGRIDRHGQARTVFCYHFTSEEDADLKFLGRVVEKVNAIREDLGSMGEVFDAAFQRRFEDLEDVEVVTKGLDADVAERRGKVAIPRQAVDTGTAQEAERLAALRKHLDLDPETLRRTLEIALGIGIGQPRLKGPDARGRMMLVHPLPRRWEPLIDDCLRLTSAKQADKGALPGLIFDPELFMTTAGERPVFRPSKDTALLHLGHPLFREALATFARLRFPGEKDHTPPSRWTVRHGEVPAGADALVLLTVEELAVNELREPFHQWVRTLRFPVKGDALGVRAGYVAPADERAVDAGAPASAEARGRAIAIWDEVAPDLRDALAAYAKEITGRVRGMLDAAGKVALREETKRYEHRLKEVRAAMAENTLEKLDAEILKLKKKVAQLSFLEDRKRAMTEKTLAEKEDERRRREDHYGDLLKILAVDQDRVLTRMLPRRYALHAEVRVFPVAIEIRLPATDGGSAPNPRGPAR
jgi:ERCC4-related helicase